MFYIEPIYIYISISAVGAVLIASIAILWFLYFKSYKKMKLLFSGKKVKDLESILLAQTQRGVRQESEIVKLSSEVKELQDKSKYAFQKIGIVRFNPFTNMGGNQSFVIALLDDKNSGFVLSSLFIKENNRIYAKPIKEGKCDYPLSKEEGEAIERAISNKQN